MIDEKQMTEWKALADAATPEPWTDDGDAQSWNGESYAQSWVETAAGRWSQMEPETGAAMAQQSADSRFIAAARTAVPALVEEVRRLRAELLASAPVNHVRSEALREARHAERERCVAAAESERMSATYARPGAKHLALEIADKIRALPDE